MKYTIDELNRGQRQIDSTLHKLRETVKTFESKDNSERYKSQITLAKRRIKAFEIANYFIENEIKNCIKHFRFSFQRSCSLAWPLFHAPVHAG